MWPTGKQALNHCEESILPEGIHKTNHHVAINHTQSWQKHREPQYVKAQKKKKKKQRVSNCSYIMSSTMLQYIETKKKTRKKVYSGDRWLVGSRVCVSMCVFTSLIFFCTVYMSTNFIIKKKEERCSKGHLALHTADRPSTRWMCFWLSDLTLLFPLCQPLLALHPDSFLFLPPFSVWV